MKKLYLTLFSPLVLIACSNTNKPLTKEELIGEWICTTAYRNVGVGTINIIALNVDGTLKDDNYIFDHAISILADKKIENYFSSVLRYIRISDGKWDLSGNTITYNLKTKNFKRLIWPDIWKDIQELKVAKEIELEKFNVYSSVQGGKITLSFDKFIKNGFLLNQHLDNKTYTSTCLKKTVSKYSYIEAYKQIHKVN